MAEHLAALREVAEEIDQQPVAMRVDTETPEQEVGARVREASGARSPGGVHVRSAWMMRETPVSTPAELREVAEDVFEGGFVGGGLEGIGRAIGDQRAFVDDEDAVADALDHIEDVGTVEDGLAVGGQGGEQVFDEDGGVDVEAGERFVEQDDAGVVEQGGGDQDLLPHAFGIGVEARHAVAGEAEGLEDVADAVLQNVFRDVVQAAGEFQEFLAGEAVEEDGGFRDVADDLFDVDGFLRQRETGDGDGSGGGDEDAGDELDGGALAGAIGSEEADDLSFA